MDTDCWVGQPMEKFIEHAKETQLNVLDGDGEYIVMSNKMEGMKLFNNHEIGFISHPKAGRTWMRYMLMRLNTMPGDFPQFIFSHKVSGGWKKKNGIVYMIRDPRDVVVSFYYFMGDNAKEELNPWAKGNFGEVLGHYKENYNIWEEKIGRKGYPKHFKVIRYENFHTKGEQALEELLRWAYNITGKEYNKSQSDIKDTLEWASFDNMKAKEYNGGWYLLNSRKREQQESYKCRRGVAGGYVDCLEPKTIEWMNMEMMEGENSSPFASEYVKSNYRAKPLLKKMKDFEYPTSATVTEKTMSKRWKECLLNCTKEDVVVWIGAWPSERKTYKYKNLEPGNCYYIDPLYEETKVSKDGVNLFSMVISDVNGKEEVFVSKATQNTSLYREHADKIESEKTVKARTLDNFYSKCRFEKVKWLHCNAEGAEYKIINSTTEWIDKTDNIWMEFHKFLEEDWKTKENDFREFLKSKGFTVKTWDAGTYDVLTAERENNDQ